MNHVALIVPTIDRIGGAERQVLLLAGGLNERGWRVTLVALSGRGGEEVVRLEAAGVGFFSLEMRKGLADPRGWIRFHRWLRREKPDVVHAHLPHAAWLARWSRLGAPTRVVLDTLHSSSTGTAVRRLGYRWSDWLTDRVTAVSEAVEESHVAARMTTKRRVTVLPNGVDVAGFKPDPEMRARVREELGIGGQFLWFAAGRLDAVKDYPTLLHAFSKTGGDAALVIAGSGPLEDGLKQLARERGISERVRFLGFEANVLRWLQAADGFVLSSLWEGLPMALLEASACSLPSVATDVPGTREAVIDRETGFLAAPASADSLEAAMTRMMRMAQEDRILMGAQARERAVERFGMQTVLDRWEVLYGELLAANPEPARRRRHA